MTWWRRTRTDRDSAYVLPPLMALRHELTAMGVPTDAYIWLGEPWQDRDGARLLTRLTDGRIQSAIFDGETEHDPVVYADERSAAEDIRAKLISLATPQDRPTED